VLQNLDIKVEEITMKEAFEPLLRAGWHIMEGEQLLVQPLRNVVPLKRFDKYTQVRDESKEEQEKKWVGATYEMADKVSKSIAPKAAVSSLIFDKSYELNAGKYGDTAHKCHFCDGDESIDHLFVCPGEVQKLQRRRMKIAARNVTEQEELERPNIYHAMKRLRELEKLAPRQVALSLLSPSSVDFLRETFEQLEEFEIKICKKLLINRGRTQMTSLVNMYLARMKKRDAAETRAEVETRVLTTDLFQPRISDIYLPVVSPVRFAAGRRRKSGQTRKTTEVKPRKKIFKDKKNRTPLVAMKMEHYYHRVTPSQCVRSGVSSVSSLNVYSVNNVDSRGRER
jgi:hypothetical protein